MIRINIIFMLINQITIHYNYINTNIYINILEYFVSLRDDILSTIYFLRFLFYLNQYIIYILLKIIDITLMSIAFSLYMKQYLYCYFLLKVLVKEFIIALYFNHYKIQKYINQYIKRINHYSLLLILFCQSDNFSI